MKIRVVILVAAALLLASAAVAVALVQPGATLSMEDADPALTFTGTTTAALNVRLAQNPSNGDQVTVTSDVPFTTDTAVCGGPDFVGTETTCNNVGDRTLAVTLLGGSDVIDILSPRDADVVAGDGDDAVTSGGGDDELSGDSGDDSITSGAGNDNADGGDGGDIVLGRDGTDTLKGGNGDDLVAGDLGNDTVEGGEGADRLLGGPGMDTLRGNGGSDSLNGGTESDTIEGGDGFDVVDYSDRGAADSVTVTLDDAADDGVSGELDNVKSDVEDIRGGAGADRLTGDGDSNALVGGPGNDLLEGGGGLDFYDAGAGDDIILSRDGIAERVDCGDGIDRATTDEFDIVSGCETNETSRDLQPDVDSDGINAPADCDDRNAGIKPGAVDAPQNGVDEDCSGADAPYERVSATVAFSFSRAGSSVTVKKLQVKSVPAGATVEIRCTAKKCPFDKQSQAFAQGTASKSFQSLFKKKKLKPSGRIEVRVLKDGAIGKAVRYTLKKKADPSTKTYCVPVGSSALKTTC